MFLILYSIFSRYIYIYIYDRFDCKSLLTKLCSGLFVFCNCDEPLVMNSSPIAEQQSNFLTQTMHNASLIISLRPFETGRADDVTGIMRITRGPRLMDDVQVVENEYLYLVSGETVKLFYR
jgi:elongator complex protein 6